MPPIENDRNVPPINWYRTPVDRETLRAMTAKSDLHGWLQAGSFLLVFLCTTALGLFFFLERWWIPMVVACYVHSLFLQMMGMSAAVHELSHGTAFKNKGVNDFFYRLFCWLTWNNPVHFRASHMLHHQLTVYRGRDKEVIQKPARVTMNWLNYVQWFTFDWSWFWTLVSVTVRHAFGDADADFFSWDPLFAKDDPRRRQMCRWARFQVISAVVLIAGFSLLHLWVLIYLLVFGSFFATAVGKLTGAAQHTGLAFDTPDWRVVARTFEAGPFLRWLYWNMNYHIDHHMYAAVPFWNLPKFHAVIAKDLPESPKGLGAALREVLAIKRAQAKDPSFVGAPVFPTTAAPVRRA